MLFSIITITKDNLEGLQRSYDSLHVQDCDDYEWIVIDGASTDGTAAFLSDKEARWMSEPDDGLYDAMNKGIDRAQGEYLLFLNAGDVFADECVLSLVRSLVGESKPDFIYGDALEDGYYKKARSHKAIERGLFTHHQCMFYKRTVLGDLRYDLQYRISADYDLTWRFLSMASNIVYEPYAFCEFETGGISQRLAGLGRKEQFMIRRDYGGMNMFRNRAIWMRHYAAWFVRSYFPALFWWMRGR
jgi:putative colanic acid biosynthesis glycosyltransferase